MRIHRERRVCQRLRVGRSALAFGGHCRSDRLGRADPDPLCRLHPQVSAMAAVSVEPLMAGKARQRRGGHCAPHRVGRGADMAQSPTLFESVGEHVAVHLVGIADAELTGVVFFIPGRADRSLPVNGQDSSELNGTTTEPVQSIVGVAQLRTSGSDVPTSTAASSKSGSIQPVATAAGVDLDPVDAIGARKLCAGATQQRVAANLKQRRKVRPIVGAGLILDMMDESIP